MRKNRYIQKFLDLDLDKKIPTVLKSALNNDYLNRLMTILDDEIWYFVGAFDRMKFDITIKDKDFEKLEVDNIIFNSYSSLEDEIKSGSYIDPNGHFALSFKKIGEHVKGDSEYYFYSKDGYNEHIKKFINKYITQTEKIRDLTYNLLVYKNQKYSLSDFSMKPIINLSIEDNYNDDFLEVHNKLYRNLTTLTKSLNILHGVPGAGKTTYIKYLSHLLEKNFNKEFVYLPPSTADILSEPTFVESLELLKDKIVIIEDAENILMKSAHRNHAINNILNITDGILADMFNIHFIFTFNAHINNIDEALLRKGRLTLKYEFKELSEDKTTKLTKKLGVKIPTKSTLAEIYNESETGAEKNQTKLGF